MSSTVSWSRAAHMLFTLHLLTKLDLCNNPTSRYHSGEEADSERTRHSLESHTNYGITPAGLNSSEFLPSALAVSYLNTRTDTTWDTQWARIPSCLPFCIWLCQASPQSGRCWVLISASVYWLPSIHCASCYTRAPYLIRCMWCPSARIHCKFINE